MSAAPSIPGERNITIDVIRGVALLGILVMNVQSFSMPSGAYMNPTVWGDLSGANYLVWFFSALLGDSKFMAMFSMLFGAGILLMSDRLESTGRPLVSVHYRRMAWLLLFGLLHAYAIWYGDILVSYALCGMVVFWLRKLPSIWLIPISIFLLSVASFIMLGAGAIISSLSPEEMAGVREEMESSVVVLAVEAMAYQGDWLTQLEHRIPTAMYMQLAAFPWVLMWRISGLMLLGMVLYRWGVLSGKCRTMIYGWLLGFGILVGVPLVWMGIEANWYVEWHWLKSKFFTSQFNYWGSIPMALGWISLAALFVRSGILARLQHALACVGRMALSNYLLQSIICTFIFYGHGLGYFGLFERTDQILVVFFMSIAQLVWSPLWLRWFLFGPFEWFWRCLTYWKLQPLLRRPPVIPGS